MEEVSHNTQVQLQQQHIHRHGMEVTGHQVSHGQNEQMFVDLHVIVIIHGMEILVKQTQGIQNHVEEVFHNTQQERHDMEHLYRHGMEQHGLQQLKIGHMMHENVDLHVMNITHGIQQIQYVMQIHKQ